MDECALVQDLALKAIDLVLVMALVVPAQGDKAAGLAIRALESQHPEEHGDGNLDTPAASVDEVPIEQIGVRVRGKPIHAEDVHQVVVLAVGIAAHGDMLGLLGHRDIQQAGQ